MGMWYTVTTDESFDPTGHYPVLAGFDASGTALYVHVPVSEYYVPVSAHVANGDSTIQIEDENGDISTTENFRVLCLRHDPSDIHPPHPCAPTSAMDPTGPFHWLAFWPEKDPEFPNVHLYWLRKLEVELRRGDEVSDLDYLGNSDGDSNYYWTSDEDFGSDLDNAEPQYSYIEDFRSPSPACALDLDERSGPSPNESDEELDMQMEDGERENQKLREELRQTQSLVAEQQAELCRMHDLISKLQVEKAMDSDE